VSDRFLEQTPEAFSAIDADGPGSPSPRRVRVDDDAAADRVERCTLTEHETIAAAQNNRRVECEARGERRAGLGVAGDDARADPSGADVEAHPA
jgi:hypothetical protein